MSGKRFNLRAVIVAVLLALTLSIASPLVAVAPVVQAAECEVAGGGCH